MVRTTRRGSRLKDKPGSSYDDGEVYFRQPSYRTTDEVGRCNRDDSPARSVRSDDGDQSASATDSETFANSGQQLQIVIGKQIQARKRIC